jgi:hypothetical protein
MGAGRGRVITVAIAAIFEDHFWGLFTNLVSMKLNYFYPSNLLFGASLFLSPLANADISEGLTEYWSLDGDYSAGVDPSHEGALVTNGAGSAEFVEGKFGQAIDLTNSAGNQAYVVIGGDENDMDFADGDMTLSIWYTTEGLYTNWQTIAGKGEGNGWRLARSGGSGSNVTFSSRKPHNIPAALNDQTAGSDKWHHLVCSVQGGVRTDMYLDGTLVLSDTQGYFPQNRNNPMQLGGNPDAGNRGWNGNLDDAAVWSRALTVEDVALIWNGGDGASIASLIGGSSLPFAITDISYAPDSDEVTLTWPKSGNRSYAVKFSTDLIDWSADLDDDVTNDRDENPDDESQITVTFELAGGLENLGKVFFRIEK